MVQKLSPSSTVHTARKNYLCTAPGAPCARRINKGDPYTQISHPPHCPPYTNTPAWTILRACSACRPIDGQTAGVRVPCSNGDDQDQCTGVAGHYPGTPHEYLTALF